MSITNIKPLLKWVGGKSQLLNEIFPLLPQKINNYYEPFIGGASILFELLNNIENKKMIVEKSINVYDNNKNLILFYNIIKNNFDLFNERIKILKCEYENCGNNKINAKKIVYPINKEATIESKELFYYYIRQEYNKLTREEDKEHIGEEDKQHIGEEDKNVMISVYLLFLNKTCFRGLYRIGPNGFNVPYGNYKNPSIFDENEIIHISTLLNKYNVIFRYQSFEELFEKNEFSKDDFIYLDPPYVPENSKSFVSYNEDGFNENKHKKLFTYVKDLNCKFLMSNSDTPLLYEYFVQQVGKEDIENIKKSKIYNIKKIKAKRAIKSNDPTATTNELLIY